MSDDDDDYVFAETDPCPRCAHCDLLLCDADAVRCETCGLIVGPDCSVGECPGEAQTTPARCAPVIPIHAGRAGKENHA